MNVIEFDSLLRIQMQRTFDTLCAKRSEYVQDETDVLHNFKLAAALQGCSPEEALSGMLAKHIVSVFDMAGRPNTPYAPEVWDEKITDSINYLILLRAIMHERHEEAARVAVDDASPQTTHQWLGTEVQTTQLDETPAPTIVDVPGSSEMPPTESRQFLDITPNNYQIVDAGEDSSVPPSATYTEAQLGSPVYPQYS